VVVAGVAAAAHPCLTRSDQPHSIAGSIGQCRPPSFLMQFSLESLAALATILGTGLSILALIKSRDWLICMSLPLIGVAIIAGLYARKERLAIKSSTVTIEGYSIDTLTAANLKRRVNRSLIIQEAHHTARIEGEDLHIEWTYAGYCRAKARNRDGVQR